MPTKLTTRLPARTLSGAEIRSNAMYGYGAYSARKKLPNAPSSITGFFLYEPPDYASEIDVEIYNDSSRRMAFYSTYPDVQPVKEWTDGLPANSMRLYVNAWYPAWPDGRKPNKDKYVLVDSIRHTRP